MNLEENVKKMIFEKEVQNAIQLWTGAYIKNKGYLDEKAKFHIGQRVKFIDRGHLVDSEGIVVAIERKTIGIFYGVIFEMDDSNNGHALGNSIYSDQKLAPSGNGYWCLEHEIKPVES